jgi:hypothetical protein
MSKLEFDMAAEHWEHFSSAMKLVFEAAGISGKAPNGRTRGVTHYAVREEFQGERDASGKWLFNQSPRPLRLVFFNHYEVGKTDGDKVALPFVMDGQGAADFAWRWLEQAKYPKEPDHDGNNHKGWRLYNESYGHVDQDCYGVIAVAPSWAEYGK